MSKKYLDNNGLQYFWTKIKNYIDSHITGTKVPTADTTAMFDTAKHMNSEDMTDAEITNFIDKIPGGSSLLDFFYPVGVYFETFDVNFNPNTVLGGTWTSEQIKNDVIVDTTIYAGTNGIVWGEKWASGKMSIKFYMYSLTLTHYSTYNNMYGYYKVMDWATDTGWNFKDTNYSASYDWRIGSGFAINAGEMSRTTGKCSVYALASSSGSQPVNISLKVDGLWKNYSEPQTLYRWHRTA